MGRKSRTKQQHHPEPVEAAPAPPPARPIDESKLVLPICAALVILIAIIYAQVGSHSFLTYDDPIYVTKNAHVQEGLTLTSFRWALTNFEFNWHPLTWLTLLIEVSLFGVKAAPLLYANVLLHIASSLLLFFFLRRTTHSLWRSATVAALFAVHPLRVESVAWVAERKDVLCALFFFLAILCYARWCSTDTPACAVDAPTRVSVPHGAYIASVAMFALGLLAKGMIITLPFVLLLIDYWPLNRFEWKRGLVEKIPFFILLIPGVAITFVAQAKIKALARIDLVSPAARIANAVLSYVAYIGKMFWPANLAIPYPLRVVIAPSRVFIGAIVLLAITTVVWMMRKRHRYLLAGWLWYVGMLVPVIGLVQIGSASMADRYTYLPQIGLTFAIVWLLADLVRQRQVLAAAALIAIAALTYTAFVQTSYWKDTETLFRHSIAVTDRNRIAYDTLGFLFENEKRYDEAATEFGKALSLKPDDELAQDGLRAALAVSGNATALEQQLRAAIARDPKGVDAYRSLGRMLMSSGRRDEAIPILEKAIALNPDAQTRAILAAAQGHIDEAIALYRQVNPKTADTHNDLAAMLARTGHDQEALAEYNEALRLDPHEYDVLMNLGALLSRMNDDAGAAARFEAAAKERTKSSEPFVYLALIHAKNGRFDAAIENVKAAIAADHDAANTQLTTALGLQPKPTNIDEYLAYLGQQRH
jgi:tetratricopeptide (TPR) repeat protein